MPEETGVSTLLNLSIVVTLFNERGNVAVLHQRIMEVCTKLDMPFEIIFVDDGSTDGTKEVCETLSPLTLISFRKNFGQTAALDAGVKYARGAVIVTMDGDLQDDPKDIPRLLAKLKEGYDVVSGWRFKRKDNIGKRITSRTANMLRKIFFKDNIHDSGCSLKAYRKECFRDLDLFGEMHRFIPALLAHRGFRVGEVQVTHHRRTWGVSKYGNLRRGLKSLTDMIAVWFWDKFAVRPVHLFGGTGMLVTLIGVGVLTWMAVERIFFGIEISDKIWPLLGFFFIVAGIQFFTFGLIADILIKNYYKNNRQRNYFIKDIVTRH